MGVCDFGIYRVVRSSYVEQMILRGGAPVPWAIAILNFDNRRIGPIQNMKIAALHNIALHEYDRNWISAFDCGFVCLRIGRFQRGKISLQQFYQLSLEQPYRLVKVSGFVDELQDSLRVPNQTSSGPDERWRDMEFTSGSSTLFPNNGVNQGSVAIMLPLSARSTMTSVAWARASVSENASMVKNKPRAIISILLIN